MGCYRPHPKLVRSEQVIHKKGWEAIKSKAMQLNLPDIYRNDLWIDKATLLNEPYSNPDCLGEVQEVEGELTSPEFGWQIGVTGTHLITINPYKPTPGGKYRNLGEHIRAAKKFAGTLWDIYPPNTASRNHYYWWGGDLTGLVEITSLQELLLLIEAAHPATVTKATVTGPVANEGYSVTFTEEFTNEARGKSGIVTELIPLARDLGWSPDDAHNSLGVCPGKGTTDGSTNCNSCGRLACEFLESAESYIWEHRNSLQVSVTTDTTPFLASLLKEVSRDGCI